MADALVERRPTARFFCHRCNIEFEDVLQDYTCPYCASGFIEQLENETEGLALSGDDFSDADMSNIDDISNIDDMSNLDDSDEIHHLSQGTPPMLNDLAFLMSGGRLRGAGRRETLMEQLVWMIGGARPATGAVTAGAPFVLVGAPGDYVFGGEGLDAVVTQLLGQLENAGPPPLPREQIAALPSVVVTEEQVAANTSCSVCWENFQSGETVSRLECDHIFHANCIAPWLQLHATCPICRRSLLAEEPDAPPDAAPPIAPAAPGAPPVAPAPATPADTAANQYPSLTQLLVRRLPRRAGAGGAGWAALGDSSSSSGSMSTSSSMTTGAVWPPPSRSNTNSTSSNSSSSLNSTERERQYNMDIDFD
ncbi:E3 ubiquitin-protein ligase RNF115 isoform X2 [Spodoptera frugiperda]|uniref:RING-type E3 ubiquitin transferase n=1 Tax=Spodoptera frugiperda TaxID=7108 RepID=A0A9R0ENS6_SPOFR|nr:E3 ubiquitin-protein ligase RNF115 isoform X2 [Spodoptera frugiperda]